MNKPRNDGDLLDLSFELTVYGIILAVVMPLTSHRLDAAAVGTICCFLAVVFACKVLFLPPRYIFALFWQRAFAMAVCGAFSWWLIYQAENTRAGWYRFHVLQTRVQQLMSKAPAYIITIDSDSYITGCSDNIKSLTGYDKWELIGQHANILMRPGMADKHAIAVDRVIQILRDEYQTPDAGWAIQGASVVIRRKDGSLAPVKIYAGGVRWSQDIQFPGDIDLFALFVPDGDSVPPPPHSPPLNKTPHNLEVDDTKSPLMSKPGSLGQEVNNR